VDAAAGALLVLAGVAAYSRAQLVLLDSPLSAVDAYTSQHIFRHCL
jgi:ABC-type taurine transport system ATPase subunit